ncbi:MAG: cytochrome c [Saprospiraceae bacterium]|nr:cytochrome c [Saprospiraceae bacterium]
MPNDGKPMARPARNKAERITAGVMIFSATCQACHQADGKGIPSAFPPLLASDYLNADPKRAVTAITKGLSGKITVNGKDYDGVMPQQNLSDEQVANVVTYVLNNFGNKGGEFTPAQVATLRK